jgi:hypothetical protein
MQSRSPVRSSFIVTVGALGAAHLAACPKNGDGTSTAGTSDPLAVDAQSSATSGGSVGEPRVGTSVETSDDPAASHVRRAENVDWQKYPNEVNARGSDGTIYRATSSCYVHLPFPEPPTSVVPPPTKDVDCPPIMRSAHWSHCLGGTLTANADRSECLCNTMGNPPPPPHLQDCPK